MNKRLLMIFVRNPEYGKVKSRIARDTGPDIALKIYNRLLEYTRQTTIQLPVTKEIHYSEHVASPDLWNERLFHKTIQQGEDLGIRMEHAFRDAFERGFREVILIGSDCYELTEQILTDAFEKLSKHDICIGPAKDGGYYLIGLKQVPNGIFKNKIWGESKVLSDTLKDLDSYDVALLKELNDIDTIEDVRSHPDLKLYLNR
ncbi:TIGR04282 family arsenosugar biosynthesis glycosyltransferase [Robertkochia solimangrovi]|uniref:TIGR04282 family arsenosugar biosynthesis glycosyltransferase n=1 Tax=Robertkochia solimangrovi TaxID=2213046 RepID=UPI00117C6A99|nr:TIGR04282 family arsenosugar biosynthesis glycosyltransferase [Robertkochia solimangrovi]TRZ43279.1 glycosyltransferase [Robertkochia solimangrovi]